MLESKLPKVGTTIFQVMSQMALDYQAINLSQGFPDFDCPEELRRLVSHYMNIGKNQYPPMIGIPQLREQITRKVKDLYDCTVDMDQDVTVVSGATEALFAAIHAVVRPGDEVIVFDPAYDSYDPAITLAGGKAVHLSLTAPDFQIDWQKVEDSLTEKTRLIFLNTPHNPTGNVLNSEDMKTLASLVKGTEILILSDEVYEHIIFDGVRHESILRHQALASRAFVVSSFGKTYHATGWKVGYCIAPAALSTEFRKIHQFLTFTTVPFLQYALADFMEQCPEHHLNLSSFYQAKRDLFCDLLKESRFKFKPAGGTYFQLLDYSEITNMEDTEYANLLTKESQIASIPISVFYETKPDDHILRFCFAKDDNTLEEAAEILRKI
ncbi:MAG: aminotransferase class I/II-fold pyridoxal phosphate-dependent enzyme [SAR324 cluster bacterium]|nr:aminotransferase class I/II-fold pyridoxal phosphate-dependent enzyme [SAR324 cluster bacterium]